VILHLALWLRLRFKGDTLHNILPRCYWSIGLYLTLRCKYQKLSKPSHRYKGKFHYLMQAIGRHLRYAQPAQEGLVGLVGLVCLSHQSFGREQLRHRY
jgi:hypothetical protein